MSDEVVAAIWARHKQRIMLWWVVNLMLFVANLIASFTHQEGLADFFIVAQAAVLVYVTAVGFYVYWRVGK